MTDYCLDRHAFMTMKKHLDGLKELMNMDHFSNEISTIALHLANRRVIHTLGIGKNSFVAQQLVATLTSCNIDAEFHTPEAIAHGGLNRLEGKDAVIFFTKSGYTKELLYINNLLPSEMLKVVITEEKEFVPPENRFLSKADFVLYYPTTNECDVRGIVPMVSLMLSQVVAHMLVVSLCVCKQMTYGDFYTGHPGGAIGNVGEATIYARKDEPLFDNKSMVVGDSRIFT